MRCLRILSILPLDGADRPESMARKPWFDMLRALVPLTGVIVLQGCETLGIHDTASLLVPTMQRSEIVGLVAGFGTTFGRLAGPDRHAQAALERRKRSASQR